MVENAGDKSSYEVSVPIYQTTQNHVPGPRTLRHTLFKYILNVQNIEQTIAVQEVHDHEKSLER
jgi:hypothetical protein